MPSAGENLAPGILQKSRTRSKSLQQPHRTQKAAAAGQIKRCQSEDMQGGPPLLVS